MTIPRITLVIGAAGTIFLSLTQVGCRHERIEPVETPWTGETNVNGNDTIPTVNLNPCDPDSVYFENEILPMLVSNCGQPGCHSQDSAEDGVIMTDYWSIINTGDIELDDPFDSDFWEVLTETDPDDQMPPPPNDPLSSEMLNTIETWLQQGAPNNWCESCDTATATFSAKIQPMIALKCQGCHSGNSPSAGLTLVTYAQISTIALDGSLYGSVTGAGGYAAMPYNAAPLTDCEIDQLEIWISNGAIED